jgi:hypothetical protein
MLPVVTRSSWKDPPSGTLWTSHVGDHTRCETTTGPREGCVLDRSRAMTLHHHALWPLQCSSDVSEVTGDRLKRPHLRLKSRLPGRRDCDWLHVPRALTQPVESVPVVPWSLPKAQSREVVPPLERRTVPRAYYVTWKNNHQPREPESHTGMAETEE